MKTSTLALRNLLATGQFVMADLYTITLIDATVYRFTSAEIDLTFGGFTFSASGPKFSRGNTRTVIGVEVDTLSVDILANASTLLGSKPILKAIHDGILDGARIVLERAFLPNWQSAVTGTVMMFGGRMSGVTSMGRTMASIEVKSDLELLNIMMPRNTYLPGCSYTLFDASCTLSKASKAVNGTCTTGCTTLLVDTATTGTLDSTTWYYQYFNQGTITFLTGANAGITRTIKAQQNPWAVTVAYPLPFAPAAGDTFKIYPGCDKRQGTCSSKFNNLAHFRGYPYIPVPETGT